MAGNFLENLIAEWYEYNGYFVRKNILVGPRAKGGYEGELDVVAFNPVKRHLVHAEPSMDANSWTIREKRFHKKFDLGRKYIPQLFEGFDVPTKIEQIAVLHFASKSNHSHIGGGEIILLSELLEKIFVSIKDLDLSSRAIPEHMPILRSFQTVSTCRQSVLKAWN